MQIILRKYEGAIKSSRNKNKFLGGLRCKWWMNHEDHVNVGGDDRSYFVSKL